MDTKALRQKILDLAIRGKLVPQNPEDEPASVLLERIRFEKQQMVKEGKLKPKDVKKDTIIFRGEDNLHYEKFQDGTVKCIEDEIPFEVPEGWAWCRLSVLLNVCSSKRVLQSEWKKEGIPFYRAREIVKLSENGYVDNELFISEEHYWKLSREYGVPKKGDLMISGVGTIGKVYIVKESDQFYYKDASVLCLENRTGVILPEYAKYLLESEFIQQQMKEHSKGTTVDTITISTAMTYLCVLPPLEEQYRIALTIDNSLKYVSSIRTSKNDLVRLISETKSRILDLAVKGKLVPQDLDNEPASVLLERIRAEKEALIKQGKIKRDKKESIIFKGEDNSYYEKIGSEVENIDDEIPFKLPDGWEFVRLKEVCELISGRDLPLSECNINGEGIPYITGASNFLDGKVELVKWTTSPQVKTEIGDLLLTCKGTVGEVAFNSFGSAHIARQIMALRNTFNLNSEYLFLCIEFYANAIKSYAKGLIPGISRENILNLILPIPPQSYQLKIVEHVAKLTDNFFAIEKSLK